MFNFAPINWRNTIVFSVLSLISGLCIGHISVQEWNVHKATKQAQTYMDRKVAETGEDFTVKVEHCVELPTKRDNMKYDWACRVTVGSGQEELSEVLQFTSRNLAGLPDPVKKELQFDHSKDNNI